jgi:hypothetical protein
MKTLFACLLLSIAAIAPGCDWPSNQQINICGWGPYADAGLSNYPVTRHLVEDTLGFCTTHGPVDDSCTDVTDCIGYRVPFDIDCCETRPPANPSGCAFANRETFPSFPNCVADEHCLNAPRTCLDGRCQEDVPDFACESDPDCELIDTGCQCLSIATENLGFSPEYGQSCEGYTACAQDAESRCFDGYCVVVGAFIDDQVAAYCELCSDWAEPEQTVQECVDSFLSRGRGDAAFWWFMLEAAEVSTSCRGLMFGVVGAIECLGVLCP